VTALAPAVMSLPQLEIEGLVPAISPDPIWPHFRQRTHGRRAYRPQTCRSQVLSPWRVWTEAYFRLMRFAEVAVVIGRATRFEIYVFAVNEQRLPT